MRPLLGLLSLVRSILYLERGLTIISNGLVRSLDREKLWIRLHESDDKSAASRRSSSFRSSSPPPPPPVFFFFQLPLSPLSLYLH